MNDTEEKQNYLTTVFEHNVRLIELVDNKTNIILGIISVLLPVIFGVNVFISNQQESIAITYILNIGFIVSAILLIISTIFAIFVIKARLEDKYKDNIFFKNIVTKGYAAYNKYIQELTDKNITDDFTREIFMLAEINEEKYVRYKIALLFLILGISIMITSYIVSVLLSMII